MAGKADNPTLQSLESAAKQISETSKQLIDAAKGFTEIKNAAEDQIDWKSMGTVERTKREMDIQVEILRLEKQLQRQREMLGRLREQQYKKDTSSVLTTSKKSALTDSSKKSTLTDSSKKSALNNSKRDTSSGVASSKIENFSALNNSKRDTSSVLTSSKIENPTGLTDSKRDTTSVLTSSKIENPTGLTDSKPSVLTSSKIENPPVLTDGNVLTSSKMENPSALTNSKKK